MRRHEESLLGQLIATNVVLITLALLAASVAAGLDISIAEQRWQFLTLALAIVLTLCVNLWILRRRFHPLEQLIERVEAIDPGEPAALALDPHAVEEVDRLGAAFGRLLLRIGEEQRRAGRLVLRAQEDERGRIARDLHDEVNQALAAVLLRLEVLRQDVPDAQREEVAELRRLTVTAMDELLALARQLRPAALDDHGLRPALEAQVRGFGERTGAEVSLAVEGDPTRLDADTQTVVYRVAQEALSNAARHAGARRVEIALAASEAGARLWIRDDGAGFDPLSYDGGGIGLAGMAERARLAGGQLDLRSERGAGTELELKLP